ncbi:MAG: type II toxin-antitoxin system PemK/MazF family toxin [Candidatus Eremiobacteraeota bacterium]|nr:type II toxin-antitoxin system PemK/MazF family toxin [Candidatus Eremiobacteraeota bacterium]
MTAEKKPPLKKKAMIKRGDVLLVDLNPARGSEQRKIRPCVVLQNDVGNLYSPVTIVACITSGDKSLYETEVEVKAPEGGLRNNSLVLLNQIRTIDKSRIIGHCGELSPETMKLVNESLMVSLGLAGL